MTGLPQKLFWLVFAFWTAMGLVAATADLLWPGASAVKLNMQPVSGATAFWTALAAGAIPGLVYGAFAYVIAFLLMRRSASEAGQT